jgi:hypothetical protein
VGVRINIDVLNSQSQLYQTKRDLAKARYDVLLGSLKLRQANGTLKSDDLQGVNAYWRLNSLKQVAVVRQAQPTTQTMAGEALGFSTVSIKGGGNFASVQYGLGL